MSPTLCVGYFLYRPLSAQAAEVTVAVASNFSVPMRKIAQNFEVESGHTVRMSFGSTGGFYAQIKNGGPFQILLAADRETPAKLEKEGLGVAGSSFTYATGKLVLWSRKPNLVDQQGQFLKGGQFQKLAIANPKLSPYGTAAMEALTTLGLVQEIRPKIVQGENIAQTYQFVATENAQLGFVALSQVLTEGKIAQGSGWIVPAKLHPPIQQDAILLVRGTDNPAAMSFMRFLRSDRARLLTRSYGYE